MIHQPYAVVEKDNNCGGISVIACRNREEARDRAFLIAKENVDWETSLIIQDLIDYNSVQAGDWAVYVTPLGVESGFKLKLEEIHGTLQST